MIPRGVTHAKSHIARNASHCAGRSRCAQRRTKGPPPLAPPRARPRPESAPTRSPSHRKRPLRGVPSIPSPHTLLRPGAASHHKMSRHRKPPPIGDDLTSAELEHAYSNMREVAGDLAPQSAEAYAHIACKLYEGGVAPTRHLVVQTVIEHLAHAMGSRGVHAVPARTRRYGPEETPTRPRVSPYSSGRHRSTDAARANATSTTALPRLAHASAATPDISASAMSQRPIARAPSRARRCGRPGEACARASPRSARRARRGAGTAARARRGRRARWRPPRAARALARASGAPGARRARREGIAPDGRAPRGRCAPPPAPRAPRRARGEARARRAAAPCAHRRARALRAGPSPAPRSPIPTRAPSRGGSEAPSAARRCAPRRARP